MRGGNLKDFCGHARPSWVPSPAAVPARHRGRRTVGRCAPLLAAVALVAAACSSPPPVGAVGSTLAAMGGTVTLVKVISPATVARTTLAIPKPGHKIVAVILTVHSTASSAANFAPIYVDSKLVDSNKQGHIAKREGKYQVTQCLIYPPFKTVAVDGSQTGCELFILPLAATPVELKLSGKAEANFTIAASAIEAAPLSAPVVTRPKPKPLTEGSGSTTTTTTAAGGTTTTTTAVGVTTSTTTASGSTGHQAHHHGQGKAPEVSRIDPGSGLVGQKVNIWGRHLSGATMVTFNGVRATIAKKGKNKIEAYVPPGATSGPVVVYSPSGNATSPYVFPVL